MTPTMKFCPRCGEDRPVAEFYKNTARYDGLSPLCVTHQGAAAKLSRDLARAAALALLGGRCERCGYDTDPRAFQIDHREGGGRAARKVTGTQHGLYRDVTAHPERYALLCANCNVIKRIEEEENGDRDYGRVAPSGRADGVGRGNAPGQRANVGASWWATATAEQKAERARKIAAARAGTKRVDGHWVKV